MNPKRIANMSILSKSTPIPWLKSIFYYVLGTKVKCKKNNNISLSGLLYRTKIIVSGINNRILVEDGSILKNVQIEIRGNDASIIIKKGSVLVADKLCCYDDNSRIEIGKSVTINKNVRIISMEGRSITIGNSSLLSYDIEIRNSDSHSIFNENGERVNHAADVFIGSKVWISQGVTVLKGSSISDNCIIGCKSIVTLKNTPDGSVLVGTPAKIIHQGYSWSEERTM